MGKQSVMGEQPVRQEETRRHGVQSLKGACPQRSRVSLRDVAPWPQMPGPDALPFAHCSHDASSLSPPPRAMGVLLETQTQHLVCGMCGK